MSPRVAFAEPPADSGGRDEGRARFNRGIELYKEGNFHAALAEFRAAFAASPSFRIQYNLGQTLFQLQDYAGALAAFEAYLAEGADKVTEERRKEVEGDLVKLRQRVARLTFIVNIPGAEVSIDEEPRGTIHRDKPLVVSAGRRRISVTAQNYQTETRAVDVAGATSVQLKFDLKPIAGYIPPGSRPDNQRDTPARQSKSRTPFYIGLAGTGILAAGTITFAVLASSKHSSFESALNTPGVSQETIDSARKATKTNALVADIFGGATIVAAGLTVWAFVATSGDVPSARVGQVKVQPELGLGSLGLRGAF